MSGKNKLFVLELLRVNLSSRFPTGSCTNLPAQLVPSYGDLHGTADMNALNVNSDQSA